MPDHKVPCVITKQSLNITLAGASSQDADLRCAVKVAWFWIDTASFSLYVYSISVALQAITVISMGGIADHPLYRKRILLFFAFLGSISATLFLLLPSSSPVWFLSALLTMGANVGFGASTVAMNAYLPSLARDSPEVTQMLRAEGYHVVESDANLQEGDSESPSAPLIPSQSDPVSDAYTQSATSLYPVAKSQYDETLSRTTSRISTRGIALGYVAGILLLIITLIPVTRLHGSTFSLRLAIGASGLWWMFFTIPAALWLPGMELPNWDASNNLGNADSTWRDGHLPCSSDWSLWQEVLKAWKNLGYMLLWSEIKKLKNTFIYLAAWFLLSDGFTTITSTAVLFGKTVLHMPPSSLILMGIFTPASGLLGSLLWPILQKRFSWSNLRVLITLVLMISVVPAYGCLGFLVKGSTFRFGGLTTPGEMYGLALYFGSVYGAFQGYARASYAEFLPPGEEARWYGLFSITDKSSSFIGPLVVGLISDLTGDIRYSFFFLVLMVWAAVPILTWVNVDQGRQDAREYSKAPQNQI
ncbi:hypothetical protein AX14_003582 [Amanita brunnescens Koide BX004]|nr:hypothetical protein AX14_003582 [Amanita brunnescens Koide BX004]